MRHSSSVLLATVLSTTALWSDPAQAEALDSAWERTLNYRVDVSTETTEYAHYSVDGYAWDWTADPALVWPHTSSTGQAWLYTLDYSSVPGAQGTQYWFRTTLPAPTGPVSHIRISDGLLGDAIHVNSSIAVYLDGALDTHWSITDPAANPQQTDRDGPRYEVDPLVIDVCHLDLSQGIELAVLFEETYGWGGVSEFRVDALDDGTACATGSEPDGDGDGVPDSADQCEGLDASGDTDSDGLCDASDNCPTDSNPDQDDADSDGIGDTCEADVDADGVVDDADNCPDAFNADQADNDGDGEGDVCDTDDDDDGVPDESDNCPLSANPDQGDADGDGQGDACDGDDDADDVLDEDDFCAATSQDVPVDADGCSGQQLSDAACAAECGEPGYVACVAHASNDAKRAGLVTGSEKAAIVRQAATSACN
jgi:hypothetical protein